MSVSYSSSLYIGVVLNRILETRTVYTTSTRYDEYTGQPYQKSITEEKLYFAGHEISDIEDIDDIVEEELDLRVHRTNSYDDEDIVFGKLVKTMSSNQAVAIIDHDLLNNYILRVKTALEKIGINIQPEIILASELH